MLGPFIANTRPGVAAATPSLRRGLGDSRQPHVALLALRLAGADARRAAAFGNRLAARVIQHHGALIAAETMADLVQAAGQAVGADA